MIYLAHPIAHRHVVRAKELELEEATGIDLYNPFYDADRPEIHRIDKGEIGPFDVGTDVVERDLDALYKCDALLYVPCGASSTGASMEIVYARFGGLPVYIIEDGELARHPWLRFHADRIFSSWEGFRGFIA